MVYSLINLSWASLMLMFSFLIALVVLGRNGW